MSMSLSTSLFDGISAKTISNRSWRQYKTLHYLMCLSLRGCRKCFWDMAILLRQPMLGFRTSSGQLISETLLLTGSTWWIAFHTRYESCDFVGPGQSLNLFCRPLSLKTGSLRAFHLHMSSKISQPQPLPFNLDPRRSVDVTMPSLCSRLQNLSRYPHIVHLPADLIQVMHQNTTVSASLQSRSRQLPQALNQV